MPAILVGAYDLKSELERKTTETVEALRARFQRGEITIAAYRVGLEAVHDATAGLVERASTDEVCDQLNAMRNVVDQDMEAMVRGDKLVLIRRVTAGESLTVWTFEAIGQDGRSKSFADVSGDPVRHTRDCERSLKKRMENAGYRSLWDLPTRELL